MAKRQLILFDVDGVLLEAGQLRRSAGAAEGLAKLRHDTDAVLSVATTDDQQQALHKTDVVGVNRYLDLEIGAYGSDSPELSTLVTLARQRGEQDYGCEFTVLAVTAGAEAEVAQLRAAADVVIALAPAGADDPAAAGLRAAGADHVVASLLGIADLTTGVPTS